MSQQLSIEALLQQSSDYSNIVGHSESRGRTKSFDSDTSLRPLSRRGRRSRNRGTSTARSVLEDDRSLSRGRTEENNWTWSILRHDPSDRFVKVDQDQAASNIDNYDETLDNDIYGVSDEELVSDDENDNVLYFDLYDVPLSNYQITLTQLYKESTISQNTEHKKKFIKDRLAKLREERLVMKDAKRAEELSQAIALKSAILDANEDGLSVPVESIVEVEKRLNTLNIDVDDLIDNVDVRTDTYKVYCDLLKSKSQELKNGENTIEPDPIDEEEELKRLAKIVSIEENIIESEIDQDSHIIRATKTITLGNFLDKNRDKSFKDVSKYLLVLDTSDISIDALHYTLGSVVGDGDVLYIINCEQPVENEGGDEVVSNPKNQLPHYRRIVENFTSSVKKNMTYYHDPDFSLHVVIQSLKQKYPIHFLNQLIKHLDFKLFITPIKMLLKDKSVKRSSFGTLYTNTNEKPLLANYMPSIPLLVVRRKRKQKKVEQNFRE
ncbi:hypothetical protein WICMUC_002844 [Wickerhamomyces mucosus]|uniref:Uncharacterized protein n=1 Tax=Wickerhamomyces mucosus TaxID=1378264 RepID=A0A9P8PP16_9ASCO|nr:hypothetical protein WICMUC_002844 [Wickerhamomyces mucosus]